MGVVKRRRDTQKGPQVLISWRHLTFYLQGSSNAQGSVSGQFAQIASRYSQFVFQIQIEVQELLMPFKLILKVAVTIEFSIEVSFLKVICFLIVIHQEYGMKSVWKQENPWNARTRRKTITYLPRPHSSLPRPSAHQCPHRSRRLDLVETKKSY